MVRYAYRINFNCTKLWNRWADSSVQTIGMILFHCAPISRVHCMPDWWVRLFLGQKVVALARAARRHPALHCSFIGERKKQASALCFKLHSLRHLPPSSLYRGIRLQIPWHLPTKAEPVKWLNHQPTIFPHWYYIKWDWHKVEPNRWLKHYLVNH